MYLLLDKFLSLNNLYTVEPLNNEHYGTNNFWHDFAVIEKFCSLGGKIVRHGTVGTTKFLHYREVKCILHPLLILTLKER